MLNLSEIIDNKEKFIELLSDSNGENVNNLISYMINETDFFTAPASTKYHGNFEGGLCEHSLKVYEVLSRKNKAFQCNVSEESVIIIALLHDLCKANFYTKVFKNVKVGTKVKNGKEYADWQQQEVWSVEDQLPFGHGQKSVIIAQKFIQLNDLEISCILNHMGPPQNGGFAENNAYSLATKMFPFSILTHTADYEAAYFLEKTVDPLQPEKPKNK